MALQRAAEELRKAGRQASMRKADILVDLAISVARSRPNFFHNLGPGAGDHETSAFMRELRQRCLEQFGEDFAEKQICGDNALKPDFYFPEEATIVEVALSLRNPNSEFERDILKALLAKDVGCDVRELLFLSRPGGETRRQEPSSQAFIAWLQRYHQINVRVRDLTPA